MTVNNISFPNLGIKLSVKEAAFTVFGRNIYWYAIIMTSAIILGIIYVMKRRKFEGVSSDDVIDYAIFGVILGLVGARLYYVLTSLENYTDFWSVFKVWEGGLGFYGSLIGGALAVFLVSRRKKQSTLKMFDMISPAMMLGQIIGRWGNFVNGEAYGSNTMYEFFGMKFSTPHAGALPWAMHIDEIRDGVARSSVDCQPTFLYESLWNLIGFILINIFYKKKKFDGQIFFAYIAWYGFGRMLIEGFRTDSLYVGPIKISQLIGLLCFIGGGILFFTGRKFLKLHGPSDKKATDGPSAQTPEESAAETAEFSGETADETEASEPVSAVTGDYKTDGPVQPEADTADETEEIKEPEDGGDN